jgi:hypothetical protein
MKLAAILFVLFAPPALATTPWENYLAEPTPSNAAKVEAIGYSNPVRGDYDATDLEILRVQVVAADQAAFRLTYRLYEQSEGGLAEDLGAILADSIRPNPGFFLRQVAALKQPCTRFNVDVAGLEYADRPKAYAYELKMRAAAIASVQDPKLSAIRSECLAALAGAVK